MHVLRHEIVFGARQAVGVGPAIYHRQRLAKIAMSGRRFRRLPFQRRGVPGITAGLFASRHAPADIEQEQQLGGADDQGHHGDEGIQVLD